MDVTGSRNDDNCSSPLVASLGRVVLLLTFPWLGVR